MGFKSYIRKARLIFRINLALFYYLVKYSSNALQPL